MIYFTAHTFNCVCHCIRAMFRVLGMYNFDLHPTIEKPQKVVVFRLILFVKKESFSNDFSFWFFSKGLIFITTYVFKTICPIFICLLIDLKGFFPFFFQRPFVFEYSYIFIWKRKSLKVIFFFLKVNLP